MSAQSIRKIDFVLDRLQIEEPIEPTKQYQKHQPIKINQPSNWGWLISKTNINSVPSNQKQLFDEAQSACKQITKNIGLAKLTTLVNSETNQDAIDQTITITANIANSVGWGLKLAKGQDQGLEI